MDQVGGEFQHAAVVGAQPLQHVAEIAENLFELGGEIARADHRAIEADGELSRDEGQRAALGQARV